MPNRQTPTHKPFFTLKQRMECGDIVTAPVWSDTEMGWYTGHKALDHAVTAHMADCPTCGYGVRFYYMGRKVLR